MAVMAETAEPAVVIILEVKVAQALLVVLEVLAVQDEPTGTTALPVAMELMVVMQVSIGIKNDEKNKVR